MYSQPALIFPVSDMKIIENNQSHYGYDIFNFTDNLCLNFNIYEKNQEYDWHSDAEYFKSSDINTESLRKFTDDVMDSITTLSKECEDYWESRKVSVRLRNWTEKTRSGFLHRIESWRKNRKVSLLSRIRK